MKLLVVGARSLLQRFCQNLGEAQGHQVVYCADRGEALRACQDPAGPFDWVLVEAPRDKARALAEALRARGVRAPLLSVLPGSAATDAEPPSPRLVGAFQRSRNGLQLLNCTLQAPGETGAPSDSDIIYEYRAPLPRAQNDA